MALYSFNLFSSGHRHFTYYLSGYSCSSLLPSTDVLLSMDVIKRPQKPYQMRDTSTNYHTMHDLMARAPDIEFVRVPLLWNLVDCQLHL
jgi:hypothetical protein